MNEIWLEDTTLREGEQAPGVSFTLEEKVQIAKYVDAIGVTAIEVGTPAMGGPETKAISAILNSGISARLIGWNRGKKSDLDASFACGLNSMHIGLPASDYHLDKKFNKSREWVIETMQELVSYAKSQGAWVSVSAEDSGRAEVDFLVQYAKAAKEAGADRMRCSDTIGVLTPFKAHDLFKKVSEESGLPIMAHMHNDFGLATANTLAAVKGGATHVHFTVNGLGERAGLAPIDEVLLGLIKHNQLDLEVNLSILKELSEYVASASGRAIAKNKAVTGDAMFAHESGIHVDGVLKVPEAFEPYPPELVGGERKIVIGKHSGRNAILHILQKNNIDAQKDDLDAVLEQVRYKAVTSKQEISDEDVIAIYNQFSYGR
ncbi:homocitrate synthase NifV [Fontibacillus solani]|uniref:Homocitrate synthase NifV n=1 Tax=Fontibacillus solani TaxID=1572857 RepID=A0A7W3SW27_9BACL|nr:homocitrate synthase family protein [Fontibacillus solani]MBA9087209.1 homocitrate synthase NifV [Fontibacillus solani]